MNPRVQPARFRGARLFGLLFTLLLLAVAAIGHLKASQIRSLNLAEMTERAERIFSGRCVDVRVELDPQLGVNVTHVTFAAEHGAKGDVRGSVTIKMLGDPDGVAGLPVFHEGEEVVLFLYGESASGLTSPVGFGQGKFAVRQDKQGQRVAVNAFANENLFRGLSTEARQRVGTAAERWRGRGAMPLDELLDAVSMLTEREPQRRSRRP